MFHYYKKEFLFIIKKKNFKIFSLNEMTYKFYPLNIFIKIKIKKKLK